MSTTQGSIQGSWQAHNDQLDRVVDTVKLISFYEARLQQELAALAAMPTPLEHLSDADQARALVHEVGAALHLHPNTAADRLALAEQLVHDLPATLKTLEDGDLTFRHARAVCDAVIGLTPEQQTTIETDVLPDLIGLSIAEFSRALDKAVHQHAPTLIEDRRQEETRQRRVWMKGTRNGTITLGATGLDPLAAATIMNNLNTRATQLADTDRAHAAANDRGESESDGSVPVEDHDTPRRNSTLRDTPNELPAPRTADQRRTDALVELLTTTTPTPSGPGEAATPPAKPPIAITVCVALSTLIGLNDQPGEITSPGYPPGSPITATQARLLAHDKNSTWRRIITDPLGHLIDYGRTTYRPPAPLARHVVARDRTCRALHCNRNAETCDLDHHHDWQHHGHTNEHNLGPLCRRDHGTKHLAHWKVTRLDNGDHQWTTPTGRRYIKRASIYPIDHTTEAARDDDPPPF